MTSAPAEALKRNVVLPSADHLRHATLPDEPVPRAPHFRNAATLLKSLSDAGRLRTCWLLSRRGPMNVGTLAKVCGVSSSAMSHQLRVLRNLGLVDYERNGKSAVYRLTSERAHHLIDCAMEATA